MVFTIRAPMEATAGDKSLASAVWIYDENDLLLGTGRSQKAWLDCNSANESPAGWFASSTRPSRAKCRNPRCRVCGASAALKRGCAAPRYQYRAAADSLEVVAAQLLPRARTRVRECDAAGRIDRVVLIRTSSITHHTNTDQRYLPLKWHEAGHCLLHARAPANAQLAAPGYYMLFLLDDCGVPSVARFIRLG